MAAIKITNPKIGKALVEELQDETVYQSIKAYSATHVFLSNLIHLSQDQKYTNLSAKRIKEWFASYDVNYKQCLDALVLHDIIEIDRHYIVGTKNRGYRLTEKGARLMCEGQMQYLKKLFKDKELKRKLQKQQSYHKKQHQKYQHEFLEYIYQGLIHYTFDQAALEYIEKSGWGMLTKLKAMMSLTDFSERKFVELKYNEADTRCWNEFAGMKSELRRFFSLGNLHYRYVIDIRSCHPLFLAHYLINHSEPMGTPKYPVTSDSLVKAKAATQIPAKIITEPERSGSSSVTNNTTTTHLPISTPLSNKSTTTSAIINPVFHYDGGNSDIQAELIRWNELFSDPVTDPKTVLIKELGYTRDQAKAALNQTINGGKKYRQFIKWFKTNYPKLFAMWDRTDKAKVGVEISAYYETWLMQDMGLFKLAETLGLHLTYEFDGCGVMCRDDDTEVLAKIQRLITHIQTCSERLCGIRPVVVVKKATGGDTK